jgi:hypothetical protein
MVTSFTGRAFSFMKAVRSLRVHTVGCKGCEAAARLHRRRVDAAVTEYPRLFDQDDLLTGIGRIITAGG